MKSEIISNSPPPFPYLVKSLKNGIIVLATAPNTGTVVFSRDQAYEKLGQFKDNWIAFTSRDVWEPATETVLLKN